MSWLPYTVLLFILIWIIVTLLGHLILLSYSINYTELKKAVRLITNNVWYAHALPLFYKLKLLTLYDINKLQTACFTYLALHHLLPTHFEHYFQLNSLIHEHNTRSSSNLHSVYHSTSLRSYTTIIKAPSIWNSLSLDIKNAKNIYSFKLKYKYFLISTYN